MPKFLHDDADAVHDKAMTIPPYFLRNGQAENYMSDDIPSFHQWAKKNNILLCYPILHIIAIR